MLNMISHPQMGAGFGAAPAVMPASLNAPVGGGLGDLFDLGGGVGMPMGAYIPPKIVSLSVQYDSILLQWQNRISVLYLYEGLVLCNKQLDGYSCYMILLLCCRGILMASCVFRCGSRP